MLYPSRPRLPNFLRWLAVSLAVVLASAASFAAESARRSYDLPADDAEKTLKLFTELSGEQILYPPTKVSGVRTNAVKGELTSGEALFAMLAHTELYALRDDQTGGYTIQRATSVEKAEKNAEGRRAKPPAAKSDTTVSPGPESTVVLSPFTVDGAPNDDRYAPTEATSGGRVRINLIESPQTIAVITQDLINDLGAGQITDAARYVAGIGDASIPNGLDRVMIRGFQTDGRTVEGFTSLSQSNMNPAIIERIEVIKGPNAILAPAGIPGGSINTVLKKPQFKNAGKVSVEAGQYYSNRADLDIDRVLTTDKRAAARLVLAAQDGRGFAGDYRRNNVIMPTFSYRFSPTNTLMLQGEFTKWKNEDYEGLPLDSSAGTLEPNAKILKGLPRDLNYYGGDYRKEARQEYRAVFTGNLTDALAVRAAGRYLMFHGEVLSNVAGGGNTGGAVDPRTGNWTPGLRFGGAPNFTPSAAVAQSRTYARGGTYGPFYRYYVNFQNDYVYTRKFAAADSATVAGLASSYFYNNSRSWATTAAPINLDAPTPPNPVIGAMSLSQRSYTKSNQLYVNETVKFFGGRLALNGGYSWNRYDFSVQDYLARLRTDASASTGLLFYGAVVRPVRPIVLYFGHAEQSTPQAASTIAAGGPPTQTGVQDEVGLRFAFHDDKILIGLSYYEISQDNYAIANPGNNVVPTPVPALPNLLTDRFAKGWELQINGSLTPELSVIANYSLSTNRDERGVPFRGAADRSWAASLRYAFKRSNLLSGVWLSAGANYLDRRPGDQQTGLTAASTPANPIPVQPSFYLPARTVVDGAIGYRFSRQWQFQVNASNLLDADYVRASGGRYTNWIGEPRNFKGRVTYSF